MANRADSAIAHGSGVGGGSVGAVLQVWVGEGAVHMAWQMGPTNRWQVMIRSGDTLVASKKCIQ